MKILKQTLFNSLCKNSLKRDVDVLATSDPLSKPCPEDFTVQGLESHLYSTRLSAYF